MCLPLITQGRKKRKETGIEVLVLAGDHETGGFALACARILASFGVKVASFVAVESVPCEVGVLNQDPEQTFVDIFILMIRDVFLQAIKAQLPHIPPPLGNASELPGATPLLIIDALCGPHHPSDPSTPASPMSLPPPSRGPTVSTLRHIHNMLRVHPIPILSFEIPAGRDPATGEAWAISPPLEPKWTLAFGRPKEGLAKCAQKGETMLAYVGDLGGEEPVFGDRFACGLVPLESSSSS